LPKLYSIILTNEKGVRSYIYILKIFEKINIKEILSQKERKSLNSFNKENINNHENLRVLNTLDFADNNEENTLLNYNNQ